MSEAGRRPALLLGVFLPRASKTWDGILESEEIRAACLAYSWSVSLIPVGGIALLAAFGVIIGGGSTIQSLIPVLAFLAYEVVAVVQWFRHYRRAQRLVAARLGLATRAARYLDFRGYARYEEGLQRARQASQASAGSR